jgi:dTDP-4-amino-4,6-dideoxygalactose transaminase
MIPVAKPLITEEEVEEVVEVLRSGFIAQGPQVADFEEKFASYVGTKHAVAVSSGTTALHLSLLLADVKSGDEVITTPFSFVATGNCALYVGARPVFVDIDPKTYNLNPEKIEDVITERTKVILPVHLYGQPAEMDHINEIAQEHELLVIEDAAQAHGSMYNNKMAGSLGDLACFSFYPTKNMTSSEGGMITTDNSEMADLARMLRSHGEKERYEHVVLGYNFRMTDIAAAIGRVQLKRLPGFNQKRIENAQYLSEHIKNIKDISAPYVSKKVLHVFHQYTIRIADGRRDEIMEKLNQNGVGTGIYYHKPIYNQKLYQDLGYQNQCLEAERASSDVLSLPVHPLLRIEELEKIVFTLADASEQIFQ